MRRLVGTLLTFAFATAANADGLIGTVTSRNAADQVWAASGGTTQWHFNVDALRSLGIAIDRMPVDARGYIDVVIPVSTTTALEFHAPGGRLDSLVGGALSHRGGFVARFPGGKVDLRHFRLLPRAGSKLGLDVVDAQGRVWFMLDHAHDYLDENIGRFDIRHADVRLGEAFAVALDRSDWAGALVGGAEISLNLARVPAQRDAPQQAEACTATWPDANHIPNLRMLNLANGWEDNQPDAVNFYRCGRADGFGGHTGLCTQSSIDGRVILGPDASLENIGNAAIAWYQRFDPPQAPYANDQHPFLFWNLYRMESTGAVKQIGVSAAKHAFHTINGFCGCGQGYILYPTCQDTYGSFSNDGITSMLGPRSEIVPHAGRWGRCHSILDKDCDGNLDPDNGAVADDLYSPQKRMGVVESDLLMPSATYYVEYGYIVRDDGNLYDSIAHRSVTPTKQQGNNCPMPGPNCEYIWKFTSGTFVSGPFVNAWVDPTANVAGQKNVEIASSEGVARVAVRTTALGGGVYRFRYLVANLDFARAVTSGIEPNLEVHSARGFGRFAIPIGDCAGLGQVDFADNDNNAANDWTTNCSNGVLVWTAPTGGSLDWGRVFRFGFVIAAVPVTTTVTLGVFDAGSPASFSVVTLAPTDVIFVNSFEAP